MPRPVSRCRHFGHEEAKRMDSRMWQSVLVRAAVLYSSAST